MRHSDLPPPSHRSDRLLAVTVALDARAGRYRNAKRGLSLRRDGETARRGWWRKPSHNQLCSNGRERRERTPLDSPRFGPWPSKALSLTGARAPLNATCLYMDVCVGLWEKPRPGCTISQRSVCENILFPRQHLQSIWHRLSRRPFGVEYDGYLVGCETSQRKWG